MKSHYPEIYPHYIHYGQNIQRANVLRYALLHHFGGVYLDLDITCRVALDAPLEKETGVPTLTHLPFLTPAAYPAGVNNAFILSRPHHPFLTDLLRNLPSRDLSWPLPYVENMLSTGCGFFGNVWMGFVLRREEKKKKKENRVYVLADRDGGMEGHMLRGRVVTKIFGHGGASSWHGWDADVLVFVGRHYHGVFGMGVVCAGVLVGEEPSKRRRASWSSLISRFGLERRSLEKRGAHEDDAEQGIYDERGMDFRLSSHA
ncbi:glycosyltransferase family 32 protein [Pseudocercospora fijiensis CIRAD86]|uniref:Glycosyltransferase family 32 protein n=1 Tax=Pseudocercospora fijiensis (strain CIRAD86) TaxID=383855 RepID=M3A7Y8_PSEFD|nr:glycosyltransferase family 32 protein [Pseudocercospora fijiensis CIRAD86]EME80721.1 glycosyltransferase family 32 protein [Pseudocercospora fijiensis CIRAD86]